MAPAVVSEQRYNQGMAGYQNLYNTATEYQDANAAALNQGYQDRYQRGVDTAGQIGQQELKDIADQYTAERGRSEQDLLNRGLGNTTVRESELRGLSREEADARGAALDRQAASAIGN